jgi:hypothetical protein
VLPGPFFGIALMLCYGLLASTGRRPLEPFLGLLLVLFAAVRTFRDIRVASTRVSETGISQFTWRGRVHLSFADVIHMTRKPHMFALSGPECRVIVPVENFANTADAIRYIESRLPPAVVGA